MFKKKVLISAIYLFLLICFLNAQTIPVSDDFFPEIIANPVWRFYNPSEEGSINFTGTNCEISVPYGIEHNLWTHNADAPRLLQASDDIDFTIEVKFESTPTTQYQLQGIIVQETDDRLIRFGTFSSGSPNLFCTVLDGSSVVQTPAVPPLTILPHYIRVERSGDLWTYSYSDDGSNWEIAVSFSQTCIVSEVGFYAGNAGGNPAFTASADYFMNLDDPITDNDQQPPSPPEIDVWYGSTQNFGQQGNPQNWINIHGRVSDDISVSSLTYTLNSGAEEPLVIGPNGTRLIGNGDFNIEIDRSNLLNGVNTVDITATDGSGAVSTKSVTVNYTSGNIWSSPYVADWSTISDIEDIADIAEVVDGLWELVPDGIRTVETGYDRLLAIGDELWTTNYEVEVPFTIHSSQGGAGVGFAVGWNGHVGSTSPRTGWPLQAIGWVRNPGNSPQLRILTYTTGIEASQGVTISNDVKYRLKAKSEEIGNGDSSFSVKIWEDTELEPDEWMIQADVATRNGSVLMITHKADVTWGNLSITPFEANLYPHFTSTPITTAEVGEQYTYNITASDPDVNEILTISAEAIPSWLTLSDNGNGTALLSGIASITDLGLNNLELVVEDSYMLTDYQAFNIIVIPTGETLPISDNFCEGTELNTGIWEFFDPIGDGEVTLNTGNAEIIVPAGTSHDLATDSAPRLLQVIPDDDFSVQVKFLSVPQEQFQMQGLVVQTSSNQRLRFETYFGSEPYFYVNTYGTSATGLPVNEPIGGVIPLFLRLSRMDDTWIFDYSYEGDTWENVTTFDLEVSAYNVGFYGANHNPNPEFTVITDYFWNTDQLFPNCAITPPTNVSIEVIDERTNIKISWDNMGYEYKVYSDSVAYGYFETLERTVTDTNNIILPMSPSSKKFYRVTAE